MQLISYIEVIFRMGECMYVKLHYLGDRILIIFVSELYFTIFICSRLVSINLGMAGREA